MFTPKMTHVGEVAHVGNVQVFGIGFHTVNESRTDTIYLNCAGPTTSVEALWASLTGRYVRTFQPANGDPIRYIRHGGLDDDGPTFLRFQRRVPGLQIDHLILLDRRFGEPTYADVGAAFLFDTDETHLKVLDHVRRLVTLPVFDEWAERLVAIGRATRLIRPLKVYGEQPIFLLDLDRTRWETQIALRVEQRELAWPGDDGPLAPVSTPSPPDLSLPEDLTRRGYFLRITSDTLRGMGPYGPTRTYTLGDGPSPSNPNKSVTQDSLETVIHEIRQLLAIRAPINNPNRRPGASPSSPIPTPPTSPAAFTVTHDRGWTWVTFMAKPSEAVRDALKQQGFRWSSRRKAWYTQRAVEQSEVEKLLMPFTHQRITIQACQQ